MKIAWQMVRFFAAAAFLIYGAISWRSSLIDMSWEPLIIFVLALFGFAIVDYLVRKLVLKKLNIDDVEREKRVVSFSNKLK
jgi:branched-subunit amino acid ABC-type transport system permease component